MSLTTTEIVDWFLNRSKSSSQSSTPPTPDSRDFRGVCTMSDLHEILTKYSNSKLMPSADDIKSPNDYWTFLEPLFSVALSSNMIPSSFPMPDSVTETKSVLGSRQGYPAYHWQWAVDDAVDFSHFSSEEAQKIREKIFSQLPKETTSSPPSPFPLISDELKKSLNSLDEINKSISVEFLAKLRKWVSTIEGSETLIRKKNSEIQFLANFCESILLLQIEREQFLDSIEEVHEYREDKLAVIVDDGERIKCYLLSQDDVLSILNERDSTVGAPQIESAQFAYPFNSSTVLKSLPKIGPFCHVCRRQKPEDDMPKCTNKISPMELVKTSCHRRFCNDCLTAYNWPKPAPNIQWKCPICSKLCTCDRCVRNVFIRSLRTFVTTTKSVVEAPQLSSAVTYPFTSNAYEIWDIISPESQFGVHLAQTIPESPPTIPTSDIVTTSAAQRSTVRRQSSAPGTPPEESGGTKRRRSVVDDSKKTK